VSGKKPREKKVTKDKATQKNNHQGKMPPGKKHSKKSLDYKKIFEVILL